MISEIFCNISPLDNNYYLVKSYNNKYALANKCGSLISDFVYDDFSLWSDSSNSIYRYSINGKKGLKTLPQNDVLACEFDNIGRTRQTLWEECTDANPKLSLNDT